MKNNEMELVNDNGTWKIKWNDGFERSFEDYFKARLHFVALVNQQIAMERQNMNMTNNINEGQIWWNINDNIAVRITNVIPCTGVWVETAEGVDDCETISFDSIRKASDDEVEAFLTRVRELRDQ